MKVISALTLVAAALGAGLSIVFAGPKVWTSLRVRSMAIDPQKSRCSVPRIRTTIRPAHDYSRPWVAAPTGKRQASDCRGTSLLHWQLIRRTRASCIRHPGDITLPAGLSRSIYERRCSSTSLLPFRLPDQASISTRGTQPSFARQPPAALLRSRFFLRQPPNQDK